ncbi:hypothetical protein J3458_000320 [Metarhizium acridum]|uniref:uncharacterized protein n=1 Tax=Metarhizium acridum TaxID=92637 RepID=UPI001C6AD706|nr:hypothetical protein J3458_000320 [Metarhizium acridum]
MKHRAQNTGGSRGSTTGDAGDGSGKNSQFLHRGKAQQGGLCGMADDLDGSVKRLRVETMQPGALSCAWRTWVAKVVDLIERIMTEASTRKNINDGLGILTDDWCATDDSRSSKRAANEHCRLKPSMLLWMDDRRHVDVRGAGQAG